MMQGFIIKNGFFYLGDLKETASNRIERLLKSRVNAIIGYLPYGSRLEEYFFRQDTSAILNEMLQECKSLIQFYEPTINLIDIKISSDLETVGSSQPTVNITLSYSINEQIFEQKVTV